ncbi:hypothetical protein St703_00310 [Sporolactobacillus terrae]|nr:hypothetical protein St703_00310 [Sporolactobacillus terrae]
MNKNLNAFKTLVLEKIIKLNGNWMLIIVFECLQEIEELLNHGYLTEHHKDLIGVVMLKHEI